MAAIPRPCHLPPSGLYRHPCGRHVCPLETKDKGGVSEIRRSPLPWQRILPFLGRRLIGADKHACHALERRREWRQRFPDEEAPMPSDEAHFEASSEGP